MSIKCFAREAMNIATLLRLFIEVVMQPQSVLEDYYKCYLDMCTILDILMLQDSALEHIDLLRRTIERHHRAFATLYGVDTFFPKVHYIMHLPDVILAQGSNFSAFTVERKHRMAKQVAQKVFANFEHTLVP